MGTFASHFIQGDSTIPENKRGEFTERIEKIFQLGGMMEMELIQMYGKTIRLLRKATMKEDGMDFYYNYFEDDTWENAGFSRNNCCVWSNKIGWSQFHQAVVAAYVLEELYTEGSSIAMVDGDPVMSWGYVGWINYLFNEQYHVKNFDPWKIFEAVHYSDEMGEEYMHWYNFGKKRYAFIGECEIYAVLNGWEKTVAVYSTREKGKDENIAFSCMKSAAEWVQKYRDNCQKDRKNHLQTLMETICVYYKSEDDIDISGMEDRCLAGILSFLSISDAPAFVVKVISELYEEDFWELWGQIRDVVKRKNTGLYGNDGYYVVPVSTEDFFRQSSDDMIPYWEEGHEFNFSEELQQWFDTLNKEYEVLLKEEFSINNVLKYIIDLLEEVNDNYYRIYADSEFFEETLENLQDKRYQTLWRMFDNMIHDPEMKKAGDVIFVPDGPGHEREGLCYLGEQPKRRLIGHWDIMESSKRNNKARVCFRRYMSLVGNKELRRKVFGF